ncbi:hypothetical protein INR49_009417, partial [Caranx melampygus]
NKPACGAAPASCIIEHRTQRSVVGRSDRSGYTCESSSVWDLVFNCFYWEYWNLWSAHEHWSDGDSRRGHHVGSSEEARGPALRRRPAAGRSVALLRPSCGAPGRSV